MTLREGDRIEWTYKHSLNRRSHTTITKAGTFIAMTGKKKNFRYVSGTHVRALFDGNKHPSVAPLNEIRKVQ